MLWHRSIASSKEEDWGRQLIVDFVLDMIPLWTKKNRKDILKTCFKKARINIGRRLLQNVNEICQYCVAYSLHRLSTA